MLELSCQFILLFCFLQLFLIHGCVPRDFSASIIIPIPTKQNVNSTDSENYPGISPSSVFGFGEIFDTVI